MAQEDFKVLYEGASPHPPIHPPPPPHSHRKDSRSTWIFLLFSNSAWFLFLRPTELSTFKEFADEITKAAQLLQRQLLSYLKTLIGPMDSAVHPLHNWDQLSTITENRLGVPSRGRGTLNRWKKDCRDEGLPGKVLVPLFSSKIGICSHVTTRFHNLFPF